MFSTLTAKYPGTCKRCNLAFEAGTRIRYGGRGRTYHLRADCPAGDSTATTTDHGHAPNLDAMLEEQGMQFCPSDNS